MRQRGKNRESEEFFFCKIPSSLLLEPKEISLQVTPQLSITFHKRLTVRDNEWCWNRSRPNPYYQPPALWSCNLAFPLATHFQPPQFGVFEAPGTKAGFLGTICASASWYNLSSSALIACPVKIIGSCNFGFILARSTWGSAASETWITTSVQNTCFFTIGGSDDPECRKEVWRQLAKNATQPVDVNIRHELRAWWFDTCQILPEKENQKLLVSKISVIPSFWTT